jgi:hypothetical protein
VFFNRISWKCQLRATTTVVLCSIAFFTGTANSSEPCPCIGIDYPRPIAYYKLDSDLLDSSSNAIFYGNPKNLASVGSTQYVSGMDGQALGLDGSFYVIATDSGLNDRFDFSSNQDFSFSSWHKTSAAVADNYILSKGTTGAGYRVFLNTGGFISVTLNDGVTEVTLTSTGTVTNDGDWHHFAASFNKGGLGKIYIDGQPNASTSIASILAIENANDLTIGLGTGTPYFNGDIDEVKIYDEALTDQETLNIFNQRAVAYYKFDDNANDSSGNNNDGTLSVPAPEWVSGIRDSAADFWVSTPEKEYIEISDSASLDTTTDAITISAWVSIWGYPDTSGGDIVTKSHLGGLPEDEEGSYRLYAKPSGDFSFEMADATTGVWYGMVEDGPSDISWHHVVGVYDGSEVSLYLDGVKGTTSVSHTGSIKVSSADVRIGSRDDLGSNELDGTIDEVRIFKTALPYEEICRLYWETPDVLNDVMPGDFEPDGDVDLADLKYLTSFWLDSDCQPIGWGTNADLDRNGIVNFLDIAIMGSNWLAEYELF